MVDVDIPLSYATAETSPFVMNKSDRFNLPAEKAKNIEGAEIKQLTEQGFTTGLAEWLTENNAAFPLRIWVVDNSGSMNYLDGYRIVPTAKTSDVRLVGCTRWKELQDTVEYHSQMAALLEAPTVFRLLNDPGAQAGPQQFSIAEGTTSMIPHDLDVARTTMQRASPGGVTPLSKHIQEIRESITDMAPSLLCEGRKVVVVLATDGLPTDPRGIGGALQKREFVEAIRSLEGLPVWVVVRLCTDEEDVVSFYNDLDSQLEVSLEVLDDFIGEATEVYRHNKWLNYTLPLHRCRELGCHSRIFDLLDERGLTKDELREFCRILFGGAKFDAVPDPDCDWEGFLETITAMLEHEDKQWNPIKKRVTPWIDVRALDRHYSDVGCPADAILDTLCFWIGK